MDERKKSGRVCVQFGANTHQGTWRIVGDRVEVTSELGVETAPLGALRSAPGTVAREKLAEMVRRSPRPAGPPACPRFNIRDVL